MCGATTGSKINEIHCVTNGGTFEKTSAGLQGYGIHNRPAETTNALHAGDPQTPQPPIHNKRQESHAFQAASLGHSIAAVQFASGTGSAASRTAPAPLLQASHPSLPSGLATATAALSYRSPSAACFQGQFVQHLAAAAVAMQQWSRVQPQPGTTQSAASRPASLQYFIQQSTREKPAGEVQQQQAHLNLISYPSPLSKSLGYHEPSAGTVSAVALERKLNDASACAAAQSRQQQSALQPTTTPSGSTIRSPAYMTSAPAWRLPQAPHSGIHVGTDATHRSLQGSSVDLLAMGGATSNFQVQSVTGLSGFTGQKQQRPPGQSSAYYTTPMGGASNLRPGMVVGPELHSVGSGAATPRAYAPYQSLPQQFKAGTRTRMDGNHTSSNLNVYHHSQSDSLEDVKGGRSIAVQQGAISHLGQSLTQHADNQKKVAREGMNSSFQVLAPLLHHPTASIPTNRYSPVPGPSSTSYLTHHGGHVGATVPGMYLQQHAASSTGGDGSSSAAVVPSFCGSNTSGCVDTASQAGAYQYMWSGAMPLGKQALLSGSSALTSPGASSGLAFSYGNYVANRMYLTSVRPDHGDNVSRNLSHQHMRQQTVQLGALRQQSSAETASGVVQGHDDFSASNFHSRVAASQQAHPASAVYYMGRMGMASSGNDVFDCGSNASYNHHHHPPPPQSAPSSCSVDGLGLVSKPSLTVPSPGQGGLAAVSSNPEPQSMASGKRFRSQSRNSPVLGPRDDSGGRDNRVWVEAANRATYLHAAATSTVGSSIETALFHIKQGRDFFFVPTSAPSTGGSGKHYEAANFSTTHFSSMSFRKVFLDTELRVNIKSLCRKKTANPDSLDAQRTKVYDTAPVNGMLGVKDPQATLCDGGRKDGNFFSEPRLQHTCDNNEEATVETPSKSSKSPITASSAEESPTGISGQDEAASVVQLEDALGSQGKKSEAPFEVSDGGLRMAFEESNQATALRNGVEEDDASLLKDKWRMNKEDEEGDAVEWPSSSANVQNDNQGKVVVSSGTDSSGEVVVVAKDECDAFDTSLQDSVASLTSVGGSDTSESQTVPNAGIICNQNNTITEPETPLLLTQGSEEKVTPSDCGTLKGLVVTTSGVMLPTVSTPPESGQLEPVVVLAESAGDEGGSETGIVATPADDGGAVIKTGSQRNLLFTSSKSVVTEQERAHDTLPLLAAVLLYLDGASLSKCEMLCAAIRDVIRVQVPEVWKAACAAEEEDWEGHIVSLGFDKNNLDIREAATVYKLQWLGRQGALQHLEFKERMVEYREKRKLEAEVQRLAASANGKEETLLRLRHDLRRQTRKLSQIVSDLKVVSRNAQKVTRSIRALQQAAVPQSSAFALAGKLLRSPWVIADIPATVHCKRIELRNNGGSGVSGKLKKTPLGKENSHHHPHNNKTNTHRSMYGNQQQRDGAAGTGGPVGVGSQKRTGAVRFHRA